MKRINKGYWIALIVSGLVFIALSSIGTLIFTQIIKTDQVLGVPIYIFALLSFAFAIYVAKIVNDRFKMYAQLELENLYTLGHKSSFFNIYQFENRVHVVRASFAAKKKKHYLIDFTFAPLSIASNPRHNDEISSFNYAISEYLKTFFFGTKKNKKKLYRSSAFCFHRGEFFLYVFMESEEEVKAFCQTMFDDIYALGEREKVRVLVQPFFGIYETNAKDNITFATDNAQIARSFGEDSFESINFYHESFRVSSTENDISELEAALDNKELVVYYQPKYSLRERRFISSEALVRWNSPKYGLLSPGSFIEKAENAGLISQIDLYVFERALMDLGEALKRGRRVMPVSVNFSLYEFFSPNFLKVVVDLMEKYRVPPTLVEVEITETTSQANQFMSISIIKKLKDLGVRVLMDDFGIGYSGIDNLRKIPFDAIKIDKSFTDLIVEDEKTRNIVRLIVELGHMSDIEVIIEGVDNAAQVEILRKLRMDTIQGFYYSRPLPLDQYEKFLKENDFEVKGGKKA
ncbi:MAG: EAL domain-containing protein [Bacilli bacterium]|nr:EAL domain-containing protein [Bacilli bacterium]